MRIKDLCTPPHACPFLATIVDRDEEAGIAAQILAAKPDIALGGDPRRASTHAFAAISSASSNSPAAVTSAPAPGPWMTSGCRR